MKVLFTHELFPPDVAGGGEKLTLRIIRGLMKRGVEIEVLTSGNPKIKQYKGIKTKRIPINRNLMNFTFRTIKKKAKNVDLIQSSSGNMAFPSWLAAKISGKPCVCYVHHILGPYWKDVRGFLLGNIFNLGEKMIFSRDFEQIIFQNYTSKDLGLKLGAEEERISILQPGINHEKFQLKGIKRKSFVLFVGNFHMDKSMSKYKGFDYFLEATKNLPDIEFVVVGGGSYFDRVKGSNPKNIRFTGPLTEKELIRLYNECLVFCSSSLTEGFGLAIQEAMTSGCPIVSTVNIGQKGIFVPPKNSQELTNGIRYFFDNKIEALKIGRENKKLSKKFSWGRYFDGFVSIYEKLIS